MLYQHEIKALTDNKLEEEIEREKVESWSEKNAPYDYWNQHRDREWYKIRRIKRLNELLEEKERRQHEQESILQTMPIEKG
jgi:glutamate synthase domain-containing protein 3